MKTFNEAPVRTNPVITILLFAGIMAGVVICGSHISKQRSLARTDGTEFFASSFGAGR